MPRVFYLIAPSVEGGVAEAAARGWQQVARTRFVTAEKEDVRLICRFNELVPFPDGATPMLRAAGYADGVGLVEKHALERWIEDMGRFDEFAESGEGVWLE
jgi:hypothetical protein